MSLPEASKRVAAALSGYGLDAEILEMAESTRTAEEAAATCGCELGAIVKSLIFKAEPEGEPILVLTSGANRVHEKRLGRALGVKLARADADFVRQATGFAIGGIPPLGHPKPIRTVLDPDLMVFETVWAAAGTPRTVFSISPGKLQEITDAETIPVT